MKKQSFLFIAGALMTFASCQTNTNDNGAGQAQIDSTVNARVEELSMEMMAQNDSIINAEAQRRADSIVTAMKDAAAPSSARPASPSRNTGKTGNTNTKPTTPVKTPQDQKFEQRENGTKNISDEKKKDQDDKFNRRGG